jgi:hypothetical protein
VEERTPVQLMAGSNDTVGKKCVDGGGERK